MITSRVSGAGRKNATLQPTGDFPTNTAWLASLPDDIARPGAVLLLGGASMVDFRIRVAQSHLRHDLLPSFWSQAGLLASRETFLSVPLDERLMPLRVPSTNAIHECPLAAYDDPVRYPNIAVLNFAEPATVMVVHARRLMLQRNAVDLPQLVVAWLAFVWGAGAAGNPLFQNYAVPSAAFVETAFGMGGIELTPGGASAASGPEAVWQAALWWHDYYEATATASVAGMQRGPRGPDGPRSPEAIVPYGAYLTRQAAAAVVVEDDMGGASGTASQPVRKARRARGAKAGARSSRRR
jgi:hypothetical protein